MIKYITKLSPHYEFYFLPGSLAEKEIDQIIVSQEAAYEKILQFLNVQNDRKIKYYLYPSNMAKEEATGDDGNGHADREKFAVYAVYNEEVRCIGAHEDTHLLANILGLPPQLFREGLAEYMSGSWHGKSHDEWALDYMQKKLLPDLDAIIDDEEWYEVDDMISYPVAGSFTKFIIEKMGKEKFIELYGVLSRDYKPTKNRSLFEEVMGGSIEHIQAEWIRSLV